MIPNPLPQALASQSAYTAPPDFRFGECSAAVSTIDGVVMFA
jgi:hypothetical protein